MPREYRPDPDDRDTARLIVCEGHEAYRSMKIAEAVAQRRNRHDGERYAPYHCRFCHRIHVGTAPPKPAPRTKGRRSKRLRLVVEP